MLVKNKQLKYLSLFSGIGGFELGIQQAYEERILDNKSKDEGLQDEENSANDNSDNLQRAPTCVGFSEIDKYAIQIYQRHFNHKNYGDIAKLPWKELPDFDLLVGGFPCQSFSIAGKRKGFEDTRGTLFFDIAKGLKIKQPNLVLLENVKGLISHNKGQTLEVILETLQELGYYVNIEVYNSKDFGVPQNRERIFLLCRHIKTLISTGQNENLNLSSPIINEFLFQVLLNNLTEVQKLQEVKSKDWVIGYLLLKEISQNRNLSEENIKAGITIPMEEYKSLSTEEVWQSIDIWLQKNLAENSKELNKSIISTAIKQIIELKTYTYSKMLQSILALIVQSRNSSKDCWKKILLNLTLVREHTKKYARINDKKEEVIITETGNAYLISNLQNFEKYFIIGHLRGTPRPEVFPFGENSGEIKGEHKTSDIQDGKKKRSNGADKNYAICITAQQREGSRIANHIGVVQLNQPTHSNDRVYSEKGLSPTLNTMQGGRRQPFIYDDYNSKPRQDNLTCTLTPNTGSPSIRNGQKVVFPVLTPDRLNKRQNGRRFKENGDPSFTLTAQDRHGIYDGMKIRRLTPMECERLQSFPDGWTKRGYDKAKIICANNDCECGLIEISDSQRYKVLGNAVTVNVVKAIIQRLLYTKD